MVFGPHAGSLATLATSFSDFASVCDLHHSSSSFTEKLPLFVLAGLFRLEQLQRLDHPWKLIQKRLSDALGQLEKFLPEQHAPEIRVFVQQINEATESTPELQERLGQILRELEGLLSFLGEDALLADVPLNPDITFWNAALFSKAIPHSLWPILCVWGQKGLLKYSPEDQEDKQEKDQEEEGLKGEAVTEEEDAEDDEEEEEDETVFRPVCSFLSVLSFSFFLSFFFFLLFQVPTFLLLL